MAGSAEDEREFAANSPRASFSVSVGARRPGRTSCDWPLHGPAPDIPPVRPQATWISPTSTPRSGFDGDYCGQVGEAGFGVAAEDGPAGLCGVRGDDQVMRSAGGSGPPRVGDQACVVGCGGVGVVEHLDH
jgi:hypothetical protein